MFVTFVGYPSHELTSPRTCALSIVQKYSKNYAIASHEHPPPPTHTNKNDSTILMFNM